MKKSIYLRGKLGTCWYNFTEAFAYLALHRPTPKELEYQGKLKYGDGMHRFVNTCTRKDLKDKKQPLFLYIHGGGWISGITKMRDTYVANWAKQGFFTASIGYSYAPEEVYPVPLQDVFDGIDFIYDHAEEWNFDTSKVVISGESAGGYYIMYAAAVAKDKSLLEKAGLHFRHADDFTVTAIVDHCGCYNLPALLDDNKKQSNFPDMKMFITSFLGMEEEEAKAWLQTPEGQFSYPHPTADFPPMFVIRCCRDWLRFEAMDLMEDLERLGVPYGSFEGTGIIGNHAWSIATIVEKGRQCLRESFDFVLPYLPTYFEKVGSDWKFIGD